MNPVTPGSTISGTEPLRQAITGVPADMASIITNPKGSGQSIGKSRASAPARSSLFWASSISPRNSINGWSSHGLTAASKYS